MPDAKKLTAHAAKTFRGVSDHLRRAHAAAPAALRRRGKQVLIGAITLLLAVNAYKFVRFKIEERDRAAEIKAGPRVRVMKVVKSPPGHEITLVGETRPYESAILYAKVSGYLSEVRVDKGDIVKKGQVLAIIESPETDQNYQAALADSKNKSAIAKRMNTLFAKKLVSAQEVEQTTSDADVAEAKFRFQEAQKSYEAVRAPFAGTVTARFADPGALVQNATNAQTSALPIVTVSQVSQLRVDVFLDQRDAPFVEKDEAVEISLTERPDVKLTGRVSRVTGELDPRTKMLLTEIDLPNQNGALVAGSFVQVGLNIKSPAYIEVPVEALVLRQNKSWVPVVNSDNTVTYHEVQIAGNDGKFAFILTGLEEGQQVALNLGGALPDGSKVRPINEEAPAPAKKGAVKP